MGEENKAFDIGAIGSGAVGQVIGTGMGLLLEGHTDRRQLRQQQKLQDLQIKGQKEMTDYNTQKQLEMWHNTSYGAQMEELRKAGLNPGLIYGQSGGGAQTANISPGQVSGGEAPKGGGEIYGMTTGMSQQIIQLQNIQAQTELAKAQAEATRVHAAKEGGIDTEVGKATYANLIQQAKTSEAEFQLKKAQAHQIEIDNMLRGEMNEANLNNLKRAYEESGQRIKQLELNNYITSEEADGLIQEQYVKVYEGIARVMLAQSNVKKNEAEIKNWATQRAQDWKRIAQGDEQLKQGWKGLAQGDVKLGQTDESIDNAFTSTLINAGTDLLGHLIGKGATQKIQKIATKFLGGGKEPAGFKLGGGKK